MADNRIEIVASLDIPESVSTIGNDLKQVSDRINSGNFLKITCNIDLSKTTQLIQSQLDALSKNLAVKVPEIKFGSGDKPPSMKKITPKIKPEFDKKSTAEQITDSKYPDLPNLGDTSETKDYAKKVLNGTRISNAHESSLGELQKFDVYLENTDKSTEKLTYRLNELGTAFEYVGSVIREADNSTDFRRKDVDVSRDIQIGNLDKFSSQIAKSAIPNVQYFENEISNLRNLLDDALDTNDITAFLDKFDILKSEFKSFNSASNVANNAVSALNRQENNTVFRQNAGNADVTKQIGEIASLRHEYEKLLQELSAADDPKALGDIYTRLNELNGSFVDVVNSSKSLQTSLKNDSALETNKNRIEKLSAAMNAYAQANKKAVSSNKLMSNGKTFANEWQSLNTSIASGSSISANELKHLQERFNTFGKEAEAAGIKGASAWDKFLNSFKTITTYISASRVISFATGKIRETITELQNVDDVLTEISKTSDRTEQNLEKLGENSFDAASRYGRKASSYLLGVQEMSRAGFGDQQSEELAELSILAQSAGDMTAEMSNEYLIATNAAYDLKGNVEDLNKILDGQNYITNRNALNMENLAQATKVAASQASASGVAVDELTAAVGTMTATTQQGGDVAGRAFKGILMNLQQVKADADEIGDGDEAITAESLSKYEEAAKSLGVSLKEVKNGVWELRDPMEILKELSEAVQKESEGSIKVANLVNAVGGKFRGNQLIALLENWDTYEKMLSEFSSANAVGSSMREAEKSANNWSGSLNNLSNSWAELVNKFVNSENVTDVVQSVDKMIQNVSDSSVADGLGTIADILTGIIKLAGDASDEFGTLPVLLTSIAGISAFKGVGKTENYIPNMPNYALL